jgi:hypothetical protein
MSCAAELHICPSEWVHRRVKCGILFRGALPSTSIFVHHVVSARCKREVPLENQSLRYHSFALHFPELSVFRCRQYSLPTKPCNSSEFQAKPVFKVGHQVKVPHRTPSVLMLRVTSPWRLVPSAVYINRTWNLNKLGFSNNKTYKSFFYPPLCKTHPCQVTHRTLLVYPFLWIGNYSKDRISYFMFQFPCIISIQYII